MENTLITLAEFHYELGFIGQDKYQERINVALWLSGKLDGGDPRLEPPEEEMNDSREEFESENEAVVLKNASGKSSTGRNEDDGLEFLFLNKWVFTKADPDSYPSVPHGHYKSQNKPWPKLNPYTGRVFSSKHQEETSQRLSKKQMKMIWNDEKFKNFCREMIVWYQEQFTYYKFQVRRPLRFPRW
ncbi:hypothetical protein TUM4438_37890 [Shewanella sairae]|uniref:Uncharacterized protein n=1 Tax=Shewanella sairae TaxID=190310 RepID=A0ABQ4PPL0_9GAMM|nr:hypothetical protein [Shewanella sairae]MCL1130859.1 hypothetical protein [Shewanella sairae]GIU50752.1 hypothetical protein TUM4438_37890 [Shewanella sairae]